MLFGAQIHSPQHDKDNEFLSLSPSLSVCLSLLYSHSISFF